MPAFWKMGGYAKDEAIGVSMGFFNTEVEIERTVHTIAKLSDAPCSVVAA
jgi:selenocysteine lyase/cysteine desulfurase